MGSSPTNHYIELNGHRYNALTGEMIARTKPPVTRGKVIDGFVRASASKPAALATVKKPALAAVKPVKAVTPAAAPTRLVSDIQRGLALHATRRPQEHSKTLMRKAVKKPAPSLKRTLKMQTRTDILAKVPAHLVVPKHSIQTIDERRMKHAHLVARSNLISRFGAVQPLPASHRAETQAAASSPTTAAIKQAIKVTPRADIKPVYASTAAMPAIKSQPSLDIFEQALARANSHKQTYTAPKKQVKHKAMKAKKHGFGRKLATTGAVALAVLLIGGFIAYQNTANIEMRLASSKAGIHASLPSYKPAGFAASGFMYDTGAVAVNFHNSADGRTFKVVQKSSNWNSDTLANEYVASVAGSDYRTVDSGGRTIFAYGNNNATWVDGGIWYTVTSDGSLSSSQLLDLARSM